MVGLRRTLVVRGLLQVNGFQMETENDSGELQKENYNKGQRKGP